MDNLKERFDNITQHYGVVDTYNSVSGCFLDTITLLNDWAAENPQDNPYRTMVANLIITAELYSEGVAEHSVGDSGMCDLHSHCPGGIYLMTAWLQLAEDFLIFAGDRNESDNDDGAAPTDTSDIFSD